MRHQTCENKIMVAIDWVLQAPGELKGHMSQCFEKLHYSDQGDSKPKS